MALQSQTPDLVEDISDDGQLTIRIPNPKVYMARQSKWVGRRGKPRCDNCRIGNLKCDRVLPMCNHCTWADQPECFYTPMPTPAHRGIPRCDRCRANNMKCDRNLPVCNNCEREAGGTACNYTPKKRHKQPATEEDPVKASLRMGQSIMSQKNEHPLPVNTDPTHTPLETDHLSSHTFYGRNIGIDIPGGIVVSPTHSESEYLSDADSGQAGRFTADYSRDNSSTNFSAYSSEVVQRPPILAPTPLEFIPHSFPLSQDLKNTSTIDPWLHHSFISLPAYVCKRLRRLRTVDFPNRRDFDTSLLDFQNGMMDELREIICFPSDAYTKLASCLASGDLSTLSDRVRSWASTQRLSSVTEKYYLILTPRDSDYTDDCGPSENDKRQFVTDLLSTKSDLEYVQAFITWTMAEIYVRMCPTCKLREEELSSSLDS
ncbi:hypothetical protein JR316_0002212 [Psilocybe cubensis]|uniref:Uncharacterized protein n=1 Tax=Psilocybe cubensis TaxID=181762 RepID=A0ACB8HBU6_PSICU|nr:hypothetical protein JR316_0002212 [Psilocybe cubensis]KAH9485304.1 hypothetical protein JR316_0002212 [Psilocybe cubensis]